MYTRMPLVISVLLASPAVLATEFYVAGSIGLSMYDDTASTSTTSTFVPGELPDEIPLNGRPFDSNETASGFTIGWHARDWLSVELSYTDFGNTGQSLPAAFFGPVPIVTPSLPPSPIPPPIGGIITVPPPSNQFAAALSVEEWSIAAKFRKRLVADLSANWSLGLSRAQFDAEGQLTVNEVVTLNPLVLNSVDLPYASPDDETGFNFGVGFDWQFNERFSADIGYRRHNTRVIDIETLTLQLVVGL